MNGDRSRDTERLPQPPLDTLGSVHFHPFGWRVLFSGKKLPPHGTAKTEIYSQSKASSLLINLKAL
jgi:hypothetical protein